MKRILNRQKDTKLHDQEPEDQEPEQETQSSEQGTQCLDQTEKQSGQSAPDRRGAGLVVESRDWYRDKFRQVTMICLVLVLILAGSLAMNAIQAAMQPSPRYFAVTDDLRIEQMRALDKPAISQSGLFSWVTQKVTETLSLDFLHWRDTLMEVKPAYTEDAFSELIGSLKNSGNLEMIQKKKLIMSATVQRSPVVKAKGVVNGRLTWKLQFPIKLTYESSERVVSSQQVMCNVMVRRVPTIEHPRGVNIAQVVLE